MPDSKIVLTDRAKKQLGKANYANIVAIVVSVVLMLVFISGTILFFSMGDYLIATGYTLLLPLMAMVIYLNIVSRIAALSFNKNYFAKRYSAIVADYRRALAWVELCPFYKRPYKASMLSHLALAELYRGDLESAEDCFEEALMLSQHKGRDVNTVFTQVMLYNLGYTWLKMGNLPKAALAFESASHPLPLKARAHAPVFSALLKLAIAHLHIKEELYPQAREALDQALLIIEKNKDNIPGESIFRCDLLEAEIALATGDIDRAKIYIKKVLGTAPVDVTTLKLDQLNSIAARCFTLGLLEESEKLYDMAYSLECSFPLHPDCAATTSGLEQIFIATGRADQVAEMKQWLRLPVID